MGVYTVMLARPCGEEATVVNMLKLGLLLLLLLLAVVASRCMMLPWQLGPLMLSTASAASQEAPVSLDMAMAWFTFGWLGEGRMTRMNM